MHVEIKDELKALKEFKEKSGWSFDKMAAKIGVTPQTIRNWFNGRYAPSEMAKRLIRDFLIMAYR